MHKIGKAVARNDMKLLKDDQPQHSQILGCNCQGGLGTCPEQGKCLTDGVVYRATIIKTASGQTETYSGMAGSKVKDSWREQKGHIRNETGRQKTGLP